MYVRYRRLFVEDELARVMTVDEVASYLRIPRSSVYKLAQEGKIPARKVGKHWRFHRDTIDHWLSNKFDSYLSSNPG